MVIKDVLAKETSLDDYRMVGKDEVREMMG